MIGSRTRDANQSVSNAGNAHSRNVVLAFLIIFLRRTATVPIGLS